MFIKTLIRLREIQDGALTAEYATVGIAACGAAGILYKFFTSTSFAALLASIFDQAFSWLFNR
ncbi:MAG: DUF4244 domain-containing protein [Actinobacteria bacterium]|jgi:hypothetical protein|nr:DUF4244 domain-containing protein [Actinomycetota bacterium]